MRARLGYGLRAGLLVENEEWATLAVRQLEELDCEREALCEGRASSTDGENERRISAIAASIDHIYARLNEQADQIATQTDAGSPSPCPPPPPPSAGEPRLLPERDEASEAKREVTLQTQSDDEEREALSIFAQGSVDTVVVEHPEREKAAEDSEPTADSEGADAWLKDDRLELRDAFERLRKSDAMESAAFRSGTKDVEGKAEELERVSSQALAARAALARFEQAKSSMEAELKSAQAQLEAQRNKEREIKAALAAMETRVRAESKLLRSLDQIRSRMESAESALASATSSAEQEKADLAKSVEAALVAAERATRQAEEMRDAAERAHQRAQQAIGQAQEVETRSDVREQELDRIIDGLEGQLVGLSHEEAGIRQQLQELREAKPAEPGKGLILVSQEATRASEPAEDRA